MTETKGRSERTEAELEYVGAPSEFADAQEVPEWVATAAKVLFFLPAALITTTTLSLMLILGVMACLVLCAVVLAVL